MSWSMGLLLDDAVGPTFSIVLFLPSDVLVVRSGGGRASSAFRRPLCLEPTFRN